MGTNSVVFQESRFARKQWKLANKNLFLVTNDNIKPLAQVVLAIAPGFGIE